MSKHYTPLYDWSWQVGRQIADPDDRAAVMRELDGHIEDRIEAYTEAGLSREEAETKAQAAMGDPEAIGKQLAALHKPWLSWLYTFSKIWLTVCFLLLFNQFLDTGQLPLVYLDEPRNTIYDEMRAYDLTQGYTFYDLETDANFTTAGYTVTATRAAVREKNTERHLLLELLIKKDKPWMDNADQLTDYYTFYDDNGNRLEVPNVHGKSHGHMAIYEYLYVTLPDDDIDTVTLCLDVGNVHKSLEIGGIHRVEH